MLNIIRWSNGNLEIESDSIKKQFEKGKLNRDIIVVNSDCFRQYRDKLINTVVSFTDKCHCEDGDV